MAAAAFGGVGILGIMGLLGRLGGMKKKEGSMKTQDLVALITSNILAGQEFQAQLMGKTPEGVMAVVESATSIAHAVVLAAGEAEIKELVKKRRELENKVEETKAKLEEISRGLDEAIGKQKADAVGSLGRTQQVEASKDAAACATSGSSPQAAPGVDQR